MKTPKQKSDYLQHLLDSSFLLKNTSLSALAYSKIASTRYDEAYYHLAVSYYIKSIEYARLVKNYRLIAINYNSIGSSYRQLDDLKNAYINHKKALETATAIGDSRIKGYALNGLGNIHLTLSQPDKAIEIFNESLRIAHSSGNLLGEAINLENIGAAYALKKDHKQAISHYFKSLNINRQLRNKRGIRICYSDICNVFLKINKTDKAIYFAKLALSESGETIPIDSANFYLALARINLAQKEYALCENNALKAAQIGQRIKSKSTAYEAYSFLSSVYKSTNRHTAYLNAYEQTLKFQDSVSREYAQKEIAELQQISEIEKRDTRIKQLITENRIKELERSKSEHSLIIVVLCSTLALLITFIFSRKITSKAIQASNDFELKLLRSQINPHFIFNSLNSIQKFIWSNKPEQASVYLSNFSMLMRKTMESMKKNLTPLSKDIEHLKLYLELEKQRLSNSFEYSISIQHNLDPDNIAIPPLAIQPFVENAIWHGIAPISHECKGEITITCTLDSPFLVARIEDNGVGINQSKSNKSLLAPHESAGMTITAERLKMAHKVSGSRSVNHITITDIAECDPSKHGTIATILIPYEEIY
ncbi:histidine kinase [uncultured Acetobacteroides sp.]|uniref:tetratricopeptide repeat-containing sensor histidine kinase n=1 Tax=uncultured Acetobacteroides sp. TaxID=1760811 RepID=UPI0029F4A241|nr:histidine kinase [uncultured Acetobacteroides sp.]